MEMTEFQIQSFYFKLLLVVKYIGIDMVPSTLLLLTELKSLQKSAMLNMAIVF